MSCFLRYWFRMELIRRISIIFRHASFSFFPFLRFEFVNPKFPKAEFVFFLTRCWFPDDVFDIFTNPENHRNHKLLIPKQTSTRIYVWSIWPLFSFRQKWNAPYALRPQIHILRILYTILGYLWNSWHKPFGCKHTPEIIPPKLFGWNRRSCACEKIEIARSKSSRWEVL